VTIASEPKERSLQARSSKGSYTSTDIIIDAKGDLDKVAKRDEEVHRDESVFSWRSACWWMDMPRKEGSKL
jgi:hypothetical protein